VASIVLRRNHDHLPLARVTVGATGLTIEYGRPLDGVLITQTVENIPYADNPELPALCRRGAWDLDALHALVSPAFDDLEPAPVETRL
jgi:hypothetical protein